MEGGWMGRDSDGERNQAPGSFLTEKHADAGSHFMYSQHISACIRPALTKLQSPLNDQLHEEDHSVCRLIDIFTKVSTSLLSHFSVSFLGARITCASFSSAFTPSPPHSHLC
eukprot:3940579-Pleurochrysis_carterae.AAC.1